MGKKIGLVLLVLFFVLSLTLALPAAPAQAAYAEMTKLLASDGAAGDWFGYSVAISGDYAVVGAWYDDDQGNNSGSAYVFVFSGGTWSFQQKLTAGSYSAWNYFGRSVAIDGNTIVVGAPGDNHMGEAYVFVRSGTTWSNQQILYSDGWEDEAEFGISVAIDGNTIVVGAHKDYPAGGGNQSGSAYVFVRSGTTWTEQQKLTADDGSAYDYFGRSVGIDGNTIVVGAPLDDNMGSGSGSAYVFVRSSGVWSQQQKLLASDRAESDFFGTSVAISGDTIVVGAPGDGAYGDVDMAEDSGSAYVFHRSSGVWGQQQKLTDSDGAVNDQFGISVAISGLTIVVGVRSGDGIVTNSGSAYVFLRHLAMPDPIPLGWHWWYQQQKLTANDGAVNDQFGISVAINMGTIAVGAWYDDDKGIDSGSAYVYREPPLPTLSINDVSTVEDFWGTNAEFTVTLSQASGTTVTVDYAMAAGTATAGTDYVVASGTLTFAPGETTKPIAVLENDDILDEFDETFFVNLSNPTNATIADGQGVCTIQDNDSPPSLWLNYPSVVEGNSGTTNVVFTVTLNNPAGQMAGDPIPSGKTVTVMYATANGTASAGTDYQATSGTLTFAPGETTKTITVSVFGDTLVESPTETFTMNLSNPVNATIATNSSTCWIHDDDRTLAVNDVTAVEGNSGTTNAEFTVTLSTASGMTVTVGYATAVGTATAGADYQTTSGTLTFAPGVTTQTIAVPVLGDTLDEPDETFYVNLSTPTYATIADGQGVCTIQDDDLPPTLSINDVSLAEGNSGTTNAVFTVTLSNPSGRMVTVDYYATGGGTATAGADYQAVLGWRTFTPGETTKTITVAVYGDTLDEPDETFFVNLSNPTNASIADSQGVGTIQDDDLPPPTLSISDVSVMEGNSGTNNAEFIVTLSDTSSQAVTVDYATADGTASDGADYQATSGTLTFPPGQTHRPIAVPIIGDTLDEPDETFFVNISNPTNATIADSQGVGTIQDDDQLPVTFPDDNLEALIRDEIGIPTEDIYPADLLPLTTLDGHGRGIIDLSGLEHCVNLTSLQLGDNQISNIQPLVDNAGLASGDSVDLTNNPLSLPSIKDLIPLLEARGVTVSYTLPDNDGDGICDIVDVDPGNSSAEFSDGTTSGSVVSLDPGITIWITDASDPADGIEVVVSGPEDSSAVLSVAGGAVEITLNGNDDIIVTSTRIEVVAGSVDVIFKATDGSTATTILDAGDDVTFDPDAFSITNNGTETATIIVNGQEYSIAPGETSFISGVSPPITVLLLNSTSTGIQGGLVKYYDGGWQDFGTTGVNGEVQKSLPLQSYKFRMTYAGASNDKTQDVGVDPVVVFQTTNVTAQLKNSGGNLIDTGEVKYYAGGWKDFGTTSGGQVSMELLLAKYKFRMTYDGAYNDKTQDVGVDPVVVFQTINVTAQLKDSAGNLIDTGEVKYYAGGWKDFGTTSGGQVSMELLLGKYKFRMTYAGAYNDKTQDVSSDPVVVFQTINVTAQLKDSAGNLIDTGMVKYNAGGWKDFGTTSDGQVSKELLPNSYKFRMTYAGAYNDKTQNVGVDPVVVFQTINVTVQLKNSGGSLIDTGDVKYYAGSWKDFGTTSGGQVGMELLPNKYKFRMTYAAASNEKSQDVGVDPVVVFQTINVTVQLKNSGGNLIDTGDVKYYAGSWKDFGTTSGGQVGMELLPNKYKFRMTYAAASNDKTQDVGVDPIVVFQTGQVVSNSGACTHYYAGGWQVFTSGMELLPNICKFRFNDGTPNTTYTITSGIVNNIH